MCINKIRELEFQWDSCCRGHKVFVAEEYIVKLVVVELFSNVVIM